VRPVGVRGLGLWTPGHAGVSEWLGGVPDPARHAPEAALLDGGVRRRASSLTRIAVDALGQALEQAGWDAATRPSVWATAHGEHETALAILEMMHQGEGKLSPTRFHNSVHNTASGYASIAAGNRAPSTTLTGGPELVASALLEAWCMVEAGAPEAALVLFDEPVRPPFDPRGARQPLAVAFCLSARTAGALAVLTRWRRDAVAPVKPIDPFGGLYVSAALPLLERVVQGRPGTVALEVEDRSAVSGGVIGCVDVELAAS